MRRAAVEGRAARVPWNKGRFAGQKPPLKLKEIWAIPIRLQLLARTRDPGDVQPGRRQQVESMRSDQTATARYLQKTTCRVTSDRYAARS